MNKQTRFCSYMLEKSQKGYTKYLMIPVASGKEIGKARGTDGREGNLIFNLNLLNFEPCTCTSVLKS